MTSSNQFDAIDCQQDRRRDAEAKKFHGWRLLGGILITVVILAICSAVIDWLVIGPLDGRMF
ncbi:MAG: hypothetical protein KUG75_06455 [Pseudomonadales bacterium]|nr:hypothetical protein [Pseudomonadales bacterium]